MAKKKISFIDILKIIIALVPIGIKLYKEMRKKEDRDEKNKFLAALRSGDVDTLHGLIGDLSEADTAGAGGGGEDSPPTGER